MSKNNKATKKEKLSRRVKRAYQRGYLRGFDDSAKAGESGSRFWGKQGYSKGYGDKRTIAKIERKYNRYRNNQGN